MRNTLTVWMISIAETAILVLLLLGATAVPSFAQGGVGAISGMVSDATGAALPGATITLENVQGGLGGHQEVITDAHGTYQFLLLVPGTYSVSANLRGFRSARVMGIIVESDRTSRADLRMQIATVNQSVTVSSAAPLIDTTTAYTETVIPQAELQNLPNRTDVWSLSKVVPGLTYSNIDVGGDQEYFQALPTANGVGVDNKFLIDGMDVSSMDFQGYSAIIYPDPFEFEETNIALDSPSVEYSNGGITFNMVTRSGTNQFHGGGDFNGTTPGLAKSRNYSPQLDNELLSLVPAKALAANPNLQPNADIREMIDGGAWVGGPIIKNRLWYVATYRDQQIQQFSPGNYNADGTEVEDNDQLWNTSGKVSWQATQSTQISYFNALQYHLQGHRNTTGGFASGVATERNPKYPRVNQVKFSTVVSPKIVVDGIYSHMRTNDQFLPQPGVQAGSIATYDTTLNTYGGAESSYNINEHHRDGIRGNVNWLLGAHTLTFGAEYQWNSVATPVWSTSGVQANFANGVPVSVNTYVVAITTASNGGVGNIGSEYKYVEHIEDAYLQDKWIAAPKLTLTYGVQYEKEASDQTPTCEPSNIFYSSNLCFGRIDAPTFNNFSPRFDIAYDIFGNGRSVVKFMADRYVQPVGSYIISKLNPLAGGSDAGVATVVSNTRTWSDPTYNGVLPPLNVLLTQLGPSPGFVFQGVNASYAPGFKRPVQNYYAAEFQRQIGPSGVLSVRYVRNETRDNIDDINAALPPSAWKEYTVTEKTSGRTVNVWARPSTAAEYVNQNDPNLNLNYNGVDIDFNKRMSSRWSMLSGVTFSRSRVNSKGGNRSDPNVINNPYDAGLATTDTPWSARLSGVYQLPYGLLVSGTLESQVGAPESTTVLVTAQTIVLPQGNQSVPVAPVGSVRLPDIFDADFDLQKVFTMHKERMKLTPRVEMFNAFNNASLESWIEQLGPTYHIPETIQRGRLIKGEMDFSF